MEAELIPMCEDQGMAIVPWAALGGGQLMSAEQRKRQEAEPDARKGYSFTDVDIKVSDVLEQISAERGTTPQAVVRSRFKPRFSQTIRLIPFYRLLHICFRSRLTSSR